MIAAIQETRSERNTREARKEYTWYFSGENGREEYTAGVAFIINNKWTQYIEDVEPYTDRLMTITLNAKLPLTIINTHIPHAERPDTEKDDAYRNLDIAFRKQKNKGPTFVVGDFNARLLEARSNWEREYIGRNTFEPETASIRSLSEGQTHNIDLLVLFACEHSLKVSNTMFYKNKNKLATYKKPETTLTDPVTRPHYEQLDYILTPERWKNSVLDAESDIQADINSDHFPVKFQIGIKLKSTNQRNKPRPKYRECTKEENKQRNIKLAKLISESNQLTPDVNSIIKTKEIENILTKGLQDIPKLPPKIKQEYLSEETLQILQRRKTAILEQNIEEYERLSKEFKKGKKKDKTNNILKTLDKDLDSRDQWMGIRYLKSEYKPQPYHRKDKQGRHISKKKQSKNGSKISF